MRKRQQVTNRQNFRNVSAEDYYIITRVLGIRTKCTQKADGSYDIQLDVKNYRWEEFQKEIQKHRARGRVPA